MSDAEFAEMAELACNDHMEAGLLSKQADDWVLISQARRNGALQGFIFSTLERIGGTPALIIGLGLVEDAQASVLRAVMHDQFHKARMAFPDEDVVVSARMRSHGALAALVDLQDIRPWPQTRVNGEERAWGRRLAARYKTSSYDDRTMVGKGAGPRLVLDYAAGVEAATGAGVASVGKGSVDKGSVGKVNGGEGVQADSVEIIDQFDPCSDGARFLVVWGWALAEFLDDFQQPAS